MLCSRRWRSTSHRVDTVATAPFLIDRRALRRSFSRAAPQYERNAHLQRRVRSDLLDRLQFFAIEPGCVLDLGAASCASTQQLRERFPRARVLGLDVAEGMLRAMPAARWPWQRGAVLRVCADAAALPLQSHCADLVFSNLMLQWCDRPDVVFGEIARVLRPGGLLLFSTFGPDTLGELRSAWAAADERSHVSVFIDMHELGHHIMRAGLAEPVLDVEHHRLHYADVRALMQELRQLGAQHATQDRARGLMGRQRLARMLEAYGRQREPAGFPATFEVICGAAFAGDGTAHSGASRESQPGEFAVPLSALRRPRG